MQSVIKVGYPIVGSLIGLPTEKAFRTALGPSTKIIICCHYPCFDLYAPVLQYTLEQLHSPDSEDDEKEQNHQESISKERHRSNQSSHNYSEPFNATDCLQRSQNSECSEGSDVGATAFEQIRDVTRNDNDKVQDIPGFPQVGVWLDDETQGRDLQDHLYCVQCLEYYI